MHEVMTGLATRHRVTGQPADDDHPVDVVHPVTTHAWAGAATEVDVMDAAAL